MHLKWLKTSCLIIWPTLIAGASVAQTTFERPLAVYHAEREGLVDRADSVTRMTARKLRGLIRDSLGYRPNVYIAWSQQQFDSLVGGMFPDWGAAAAIPHRKRIVIKSPDRFNVNKSLEQLMAHEWSHLALDDRLGVVDAPRWFDEGLAQYVSFEWSWEKNLAMGKAAVFGQLIPLREIDQVNTFTGPKAEVAYAQSFLAVDYLFNKYSDNAANIFLDELAAGKSVDEALMASTGSDYAGFEEEFQAYLAERFNVVTLFLDTMWFWFALALIVIIGAFIKYRRRRQYYQKWEEEEKFQSTDFDWGDPENPEQTDDDEPWRQ